MPAIAMLYRTALTGLVLALLSIPAYAQSTFWIPTNGPYGGPVRALLADRNGNLFAATEHATYRSTDNGDTWSRCSSLSPATNAFVVDSSGTIYAGGNGFYPTDRGLWKSTDAGLSWQEVAPAGQSILCLTVAPDNTVYAGVDGPDLRGVFRSYRIETGWASQSSGTDRALYGVSFAGVDTAIVVGDDGTILRTTDDGATWNTQPGGTTESLYGVSFADASTGIAVGASGTILRTTDGGVTWDSLASGTTVHLRSVCFTAADTGTVVGYGGTILRTIDGGVTWTSQTSGTSTNLFGVFFTDAMNGTAVGSSPTILRTTDGGTTWEPRPTGATVNFTSVYFADANTGVAVGDNFGGPMLLRTSDGGATWTDQKIANTIGSTITLFGVCFTDANTGMAVGCHWQGGAIVIRTTDGGMTWMSLPADTTDFLYAVDFLNDTCGIAVGRNGTIRHTTPGAETVWLPHGLSGQKVGHLLVSARHGLLATVDWSSVYRGSLADTAWLQIGSTSSRPHTFVEDTAGNLYVGLEVDGVDASTDGGATWHATGLDRPFTVTSLSTLPTGEIYAGVYPLDPSIDGGAWRSTDAGTTWERLQLDEWGMHTVLARDQSTLFLGSSRGIFRSTTGGSSWDVACTGIAAAENRALLCIDQSTLFSGTVAGLFRSTDDGESWHESGAGISPRFITSLAADDKGNLFAGNMVFSPKGGIYKSTDRGESWRNTTRDSITGMYTGITSIVATRSNVLVAGVYEPYRIVRSTDDGETWSRAVTPRSVNHIALDSAGILYGSTWGYGVLRSTDDGATWDFTGPGLHNLNIECIAARDTGEVFAGGIGGASRSTNAGDSWIFMTAPLSNIIAKAITVGEDGVIILSTTDRRVFRTTDDGETWTLDTIRPPSTTGKVFAVDGISDSGPVMPFIQNFAGMGRRMFATDSIGYVYRYQGSTNDADLRGGYVPVTARLEQNFPNPFNPATTIRYEVPSAGYVRLCVFDLLGREVAVLVNEKKAPGSYQVQFDAAGLASGVYLYRLTAGSFLQTRKMVVVR